VHSLSAVYAHTEVTNELYILLTYRNELILLFTVAGAAVYERWTHYCLCVTYCTQEATVYNNVLAFR